MKNSLIMIVTSVLMACGVDDDSSNNTNQNENQNSNSNQGVCGDGVLSPAYEECDEGSRNSDARPDACRSNCVWAYCGDSTIDSSEECDHNELSGNTCQTFGYTKGALACSAGCEYDYQGCSLCGNGVAEGDNNSQVHYEVCDGSDLRGQDCVSVGHASGVLRCSLTCQYDITGCVGGGTVCGNGVIEFGETCDDGNQNNFDACPDGPGGTCQDATCGDGFVWADHETCDDGNHWNGDDCPDGVGGSCQDATCGDGFVWVGTEQCDPAADASCYADCSGKCGDGVIQWNATVHEVCDDHNITDDATCHSDCLSYGGDGIIQPEHGEECENGQTAGCASGKCSTDRKCIVWSDGRCDVDVATGKQENSGWDCHPAGTNWSCADILEQVKVDCPDMNTTCVNTYRAYGCTAGTGQFDVLLTRRNLFCPGCSYSACYNQYNCNEGIVACEWQTACP